MFRRLIEQLFGRSRQVREEVVDLDLAAARYTVDEARERLRPLLEDPRLYRVVRSTPLESEVHVVGALPPSGRDLFSEFELVQEEYGDTRLSRSEIGRSHYAPGMTRIGTALDSTELVVSGSDEAVYRIDGSERAVEEMDRYESIWHYLLLMAMIIYPRSFQ